MVKMILCLRRQPSFTRRAFSDHWRTVHAPLVTRHAATIGITRYVQNHALDASGTAPLTGRRVEPYDGIAEIWFDDLEPFKTPDAAAQAALKEIVADDEHFTDWTSSPAFFGTEIPILGQR